MAIWHPGKEHGRKEIKRWLKQFKTDQEGCISREELREAIRREAASSFSGQQLDDKEIEGLIQLAGELGFRITTADAAVRPGSCDTISGSDDRAPKYQKSKFSYALATYYQRFMESLLGQLSCSVVDKHDWQ